VLDGYDATRQIKAVPGLTAIPIIAVSSFTMKGDEEKARAAGCDHYVTKPYSPVQLLRTTKEAGHPTRQSDVDCRFTFPATWRCQPIRLVGALASIASLMASLRCPLA